MHRLWTPVNKDMNEQYVHICVYIHTHTVHYTCPPYFGYDGEHVTFARDGFNIGGRQVT